MARYSAAISAPATSPAVLGTPMWQLIASNTGKCALVEISAYMPSSNQATGIGRCATNGTTVYRVSHIPDDPSDPPSYTTVATLWTVAPTVPAQYFRRYAPRAAAGSGFMFLFPMGIKVNSSTSLGAFFLAGTGASGEYNSVITE